MEKHPHTIISAIVAIDNANYGIGMRNTLSWKLKEDLEFFKKITQDFPVIMGRPTWESLPKKFRPLPHRANIVVTHNPDYLAEGATCVSSLSDGIVYAVETYQPEKIFIIGGANIYAQALLLLDELYVTHITGLPDQDYDVFFPENFEDFFSDYETLDILQDIDTVSGNTVTLQFRRYFKNKKTN